MGQFFITENIQDFTELIENFLLMKNIIYLVLYSALGIAAVVTNPTWQPLFNGENLDNWDIYLDDLSTVSKTWQKKLHLNAYFQLWKKTVKS